jgi:hypothetical protein
MIKFNYDTFSQNFTPHSHSTWIPVAKTGVGFILAGLIILLLKELLVAVLSTIAIGIGIYILLVAFRIYQLNR